MDDLIKTLKDRRRKLKLTQQEISDKIYVSQNTFSEYETGRKELKLSRLKDLAKELNGEIKFVPKENQKISTKHFHQICVIANDEKSKEIINSDTFREKFNIVLNDLWCSYEYSTELGKGIYSDKIIINEKTENSNLFIKENDLCVLDFNELSNKSNKDITIEGKTYPKENIVCSMYDINGDNTNKIDELICTELYDFIKEEIEGNIRDYFNSDKEYDEYYNKEDLFIVNKVSPLYDTIDNNKYEFDYFIR